MMRSQSPEVVLAIPTVHKLLDLEHSLVIFSHPHEDHILVRILSDRRLGCTSRMECHSVALWIFGYIQYVNMEVLEQGHDAAEMLSILGVVEIWPVQSSWIHTLRALWSSWCKYLFDVPFVEAIHCIHGCLVELRFLGCHDSQFALGAPPNQKTPLKWQRQQVTELEIRNAIRGSLRIALVETLPRKFVEMKLNLLRHN